MSKDDTRRENDSTEGSTRRRIKIQPKNPKRIEVHASNIIPATDLLMHDAKCILGAELAKYRQKTTKGISLDPKEARVVIGYLDSLAKLQKEEREAARQQDLSNLTDEELFQLAAKVLGNSNQKLINNEDE